jgi:hypothetical protein
MVFADALEYSEVIGNVANYVGAVSVQLLLRMRGSGSVKSKGICRRIRVLKLSRRCLWRCLWKMVEV